MSAIVPSRPRLALLLAALLLLAAPARGAGLVADLSHHLVAITTAFAGTDVLLFGTTGAAGRDVIVTVEGPRQPTTVRRKTKVGFVWLNTQEVAFRAVPAFYAVAASGPLEAIADPADLARHQIGAERLAREAIRIAGVGDSRLPEFERALLRRKERHGLFAPRPGRVTFVGDLLFRTTLSFPANTPPGTYRIQVFELDAGQVVAAQASALVVSKVGLEADLFDLAHRNAAVYGLGSVLIAIIAGWSAAALFRKA
jgi:uncharacterized protein (TIGR02186 family)